VEDDIEIVAEDPRPLLHAVDGARAQVLLLLERAVHLVPDRGGLARVAPGRDHEVVGEGAHRPHVEDDDVLGKLLLGESRDAACLFEWCQSWIGFLARDRSPV
jgi:hypothetical protein